jgi:thioredoxin-like negative regulator of GroEL
VARPMILPHMPDTEAEHLHAKIEVAEWSTEPADGRLGDARRSAARGDWTDALEGMIAALPDQRDDARQALVTAFAALGDDDPLVSEFRRRLAAALF